MQGSGTLTLNGANTYTGPTTVEAGTPTVSQPSLSAAESVTLVGSATRLNLTYSGTCAVAELWINGEKMEKGVWGSSTSGAANVSASLTGTGTLTVTGKVTGTVVGIF